VRSYSAAPHPPYQVQPSIENRNDPRPVEERNDTFVVAPQDRTFVEK